MDRTILDDGFPVSMADVERWFVDRASSPMVHRRAMIAS